MILQELEIVYLLLTLPLMFGLVLLGVGFSKLLNGGKIGPFVMILGIAVIILVGIAFWYYSDYFNSRVNVL